MRQDKFIIRGSAVAFGACKELRIFRGVSREAVPENRRDRVFGIRCECEDKQGENPFALIRLQRRQDSGDAWLLRLVLLRKTVYKSRRGDSGKIQATLKTDKKRRSGQTKIIARLQICELFFVSIAICEKTCIMIIGKFGIYPYLYVYKP